MSNAAVVVSGPELPPIGTLSAHALLAKPSAHPPLLRASSSFPADVPPMWWSLLLFGLLVPPLSTQMLLLSSASGTGGAECTELNDPTPATPQQSTAKAAALIGHSLALKRIGSLGQPLLLLLTTTVSMEMDVERRIGSESAVVPQRIGGEPDVSVTVAVALPLLLLAQMLMLANIPAGPLERCTDPRESCPKRSTKNG